MFFRAGLVAPFTGAWIETPSVTYPLILIGPGRPLHGGVDQRLGGGACPFGGESPASWIYSLGDRFKMNLGEESIPRTKKPTERVPWASGGSVVSGRN